MSCILTLFRLAVIVIMFDTPISTPKSSQYSLFRMNLINFIVVREEKSYCTTHETAHFTFFIYFLRILDIFWRFHEPVSMSIVFLLSHSCKNTPFLAPFHSCLAFLLSHPLRHTPWDPRRHAKVSNQLPPSTVSCLFIFPFPLIKYRNSHPHDSTPSFPIYLLIFTFLQLSSFPFLPSST